MSKLFEKRPYYLYILQGKLIHAMVSRLYYVNALIN